MPTTPLAPALFSTTTGCPIDSLIFCASVRPVRSEAPPGANGTTSLIGFVGYDGVWANVCGAISAAAARTSILTFFISLLRREPGLPQSPWAPDDAAVRFLVALAFFVGEIGHRAS